MQNVMRVLRSKSRKDDARTVGFAVAVGVAKVQQFGAVGDIDSSVARSNSRRNHQPVGKDTDSICLSCSLRIGNYQDLVIGFLSRLDLRIDLRRGHPQIAGGVEVYLNRLGQQRVRREQIDLEPRAFETIGVRVPIDRNSLRRAGPAV